MNNPVDLEAIAAQATIAEENPDLGEESVAPGTPGTVEGENEAMLSLFRQMPLGERAEVLQLLFSEFCPECGNEHTACRCEGTGGLAGVG